jgi:DNA repair protein RecO (recombination protein O)
MGGRHAAAGKTALLCGFYLNELLVKLLARDDAHPALFDHYVSTLNQLAHNEPAPIVCENSNGLT